MSRNKLRWPNRSQWSQLFKVFKRKEKILLLSFILLFVISAIYLSVGFYYHHTTIKATKGGTYRQGVIGSPRFINPIYLAKNDVDRDLVGLIFSGLMKYNSEGKIVPDLARDYPQISADGKVYEVHLRNNCFFQDKTKVTADDVVFTVKTIQNPDFKSPLRANWLGVKVEKVSPYTVKFTLKNSYPAFLENLTLKIIPQHIWKNITPQQFPLSIYNFQPIGSGPYRIKSIKQDKDGKIISINLEYFKKYYGQSPYIRKISFIFFKDENEMIENARRGYIDAFSSSLPSKSEENISGFQKYIFYQPRYFAVFFNLGDKNNIFKDIRIRKALNYGTDKKEILEQAVSNQGVVVDSPILPGIYNYSYPSTTYKFDETKARDLLQESGFVIEKGQLFKKIPANKLHFSQSLKYGDRGPEVKKLQECLANLPDKSIYPDKTTSGYFGPKTKSAVIRFQNKYAKDILTPIHLKRGTGDVRGMTIKKLNEVCTLSPAKTIPFTINLDTGQDPLLEKIAEILQKQWAKLGLQTEIKTYSINDLEKEIIEPRKYQAILFGEALKFEPDLYPFWHSTQAKYPGLNLSEYDNKKADKLLEKIREEKDSTKRRDYYEELQNIIIKDAPAIFLFRPNYIYSVSQRIKGVTNGKIIDTSQIFSQINNWYINTGRKWK